MRVGVTREALDGIVHAKPARVAVIEGRPGEPGRIRVGQSLRERLVARGLPIVEARAHGPDLLGAAGWFEAVEEARLLQPIAFRGGALELPRTEAFMVIDVDGHLPPAELAIEAAGAVGSAIRRLGIGGSTVIDFPTVADREVRKRVGEALDAAVPSPFERTAMNGFGLVQIVRPRERASLVEQVSPDNYATDACRLLREAERAAGAGTTVVAAMAPVVEWLERRPALLAELARRTGRPVALRVDAAQTMSGGHVHVA